MSYYFMVQIEMIDEDEYQKYLDKVDEVFSKFNGKYLAVDDSPKIIEGTWKYSRSVLIEFESENDFNSWYFSDDYQSIIKHRLEGAYCDFVLVKGLK
ncbi:DUF1330 domain-containing protein [Carboxylicivirga linearis]|uniref:DUF1330 domain-containing protein n=1 Tax=Carboxylicivirga linearis TaxID=1628157 RepID=A0ABS5JP62_9BACT|nr:DUF1330 domain-containing protein [Carboxylicivirga linearis]MBS2096689.1 DUF1330 domain-containing protein [Carboxylicivirga linearis]